VSIHYDAMLEWDGSLFDSTRDGAGEPKVFALGQGLVIPGLDMGIATMKRGELAKLTIHPDFAYGEAGSKELKVPGRTAVVFDLEILDWAEKIDLFGDGSCVKTVLKEGCGSKMPKYLDEVLISVKAVGPDGTVILETVDVENLLGSPHLGPMATACNTALPSMRKGEVVSLKCAKKHFLYPTDADKCEGGTIELTLHEIYETRDVSFSKDNSVLKKQIREGHGLEKPRDFSIVTLKVEAATDGEEKLLPGFVPKTLEFTAGNGEVCDALECAVLDMKVGERAIVTCDKPGACVEAQVGLTEKPDVDKVMLLLTLEDMSDISEEDKLALVAKGKEAGSALFKEGHIELALERYTRTIDKCLVIDNFAPGNRERAKELRKLCWLNKSMCHLRLKRHWEAKVSCDQVLLMDSENMKALFRRAQAHLALRQVNDCIIDAKRVIQMEPQNQEVRKLLAEARAAQKGGESEAKDVFANMLKGLTSPPPQPAGPKEATMAEIMDLCKNPRPGATSSPLPQPAGPEQETMAKIMELCKNPQPQATSSPLPQPPEAMSSPLPPPAGPDQEIAKIMELCSKSQPKTEEDISKQAANDGETLRRIQEAMSAPPPSAESIAKSRVPVSQESFDRIKQLIQQAEAPR